jgi:hypothetical protein
MKKIFIAAVVLILANSSINAQGILDKAKTGDVSSLASAFDVKSIAGSVMGALTPALGLTQTQQPSVLTQVTSLLTKKKDILPLQATDKASYISKLSALSGGFMTKIKGIITAAQYAKLLGLKPKTASSTNVLSQLFF